MYIDFHTHGKLAKKLPFSEEYTDWLFEQAKKAGLDALCLTEHFNTLQFEELYRYLEKVSTKEGDSLVLENGLRIFAGMETDIAEGGHILSIGCTEEILELNHRLKPYMEKEHFLPFRELMEMFSDYQVIVGAAHPFREGGHIPELSPEELINLDFLDLNGKDVAAGREEIKKKTYALADRLGIPVVGGSDTHQALQYGCIRTRMYRETETVSMLFQDMREQKYEILISDAAAEKVENAALLKRTLKAVHELGGSYVSVLLNRSMTGPREKNSMK